MAEIKVGERVALVDEEDVALVSAYAWRVLRGSRKARTLYAATAVNGGGRILMHRLIAGAAAGEYVDHRNHDGLDNRRNNLRKCTNQQNCFNRRVSRRSKSGLKGVQFDPKRAKRAKHWRAKATLNGKTVHVGWFATAEEASIAYLDFARQHHGEFFCI